MDAASIAKALEGRKPGSFFSVTVRRPAKVRKGTTEVIEKMTVMTGQLCDYAARAAVKNAVADGERDAPELPSHISHSFKEGNVKFWQGNNGEVYLPMPMAGKSTVTWFLGGEPVDYSEVEPYLLAADKPKPHKTKEELAELGQVAFSATSLKNIIDVH